MADEMLVEKLMKFGLSRQESIVYLCLCRNGGLTGYEAAKQTGISRSNVYGAMAGLVDKGAADVLESVSSKYVAVPIEEFTEDCLRHLQETRMEIIRTAPKKAEQVDGYISIEGYQHILNKVRHMFHSIEQRVYISAKEDILALFTEEISAVVKEKKKVVILSDDIELLQKKLSMTLSMEEIESVIFYRTNRKDTHFRLIVDSRYVLTGELTGAKADTALYSAQLNFVNVFKEALHNEIRLIELTEKKDEKKVE